MDDMFKFSIFSGDISNWNARSIVLMRHMFDNAKTPKPYWAEFEDKNERLKAIESYRLKNGLVKELREELGQHGYTTKKLKV
jgi:hypothetical protein